MAVEAADARTVGHELRCTETEEANAPKQATTSAAKLCHRLDNLHHLELCGQQNWNANACPKSAATLGPDGDVAAAAHKVAAVLLQDAHMPAEDVVDVAVKYSAAATDFAALSKSPALHHRLL